MRVYLGLEVGNIVQVDVWCDKRVPSCGTSIVYKNKWKTLVNEKNVRMVTLEIPKPLF